jgi:hypothetical protein
MKEALRVLLIHIVMPVMIGLMIYYGYKHLFWYPTNKACHDQCIAQGHTAGEEAHGFEHDVCECFKLAAGPPVRFLLKASDRLED